MRKYSSWALVSAWPPKCCYDSIWKFLCCNRRKCWNMLKHGFCFGTTSCISLLSIHWKGVRYRRWPDTKGSYQCTWMWCYPHYRNWDKLQCDIFIPDIDSLVFHPWHSSFPLVENNIRYSFMTYVRVRSSEDESQIQNNGDCGWESIKFEVKKFYFLHKIIFERHEEYIYLSLVEDIISNDVQRDDKTGTGTLSKSGCQMRFNLWKTFPFLTTKKVFWWWIVEELLWFISGSTNAKVLQENGIHIWDGNASKDYLDSIGLEDKDEEPVSDFNGSEVGNDFEKVIAGQDAYPF